MEPEPPQDTVCELPQQAQFTVTGMFSPPQPGNRIADIPEDDRPREKMLKRGAGSLTDAELLAIFFGSGTRGLSAIDLGKLFMQRYRSLNALSRLKFSELVQQKGIGEAKALHLAAAFELGRRLAVESDVPVMVDTTQALLQLVETEMRQEAVEVMLVVIVNTRLCLLGVERVSVGTLNETVASPREVLHPVLMRRGYAFALVHNHPSGDPSPSAADRSFTTRIRQAAELLQIRFLDHVIIGQQAEGRAGYYSFREAGML